MTPVQAPAAQWEVCFGDATYVRVPDVVKPINCGSKARAAQIVLAVNCHAELVAALDALVDASANCGETGYGGPEPTAWDAARAALSRATGSEQ